MQVFVSEIWYSQYWKGTEGSTEFRLVPKGSGGCGFWKVAVGYCQAVGHTHWAYVSRFCRSHTSPFAFLQKPHHPRYEFEPTRTWAQKVVRRTETSTVGFEQLNSMVPGVTFAAVGHGQAEQICTKAMKSTYGTRCIDSLHLVGACSCRFKRITCSVELASNVVTVNIPNWRCTFARRAFGTAQHLRARATLKNYCRILQIVKEKAAQNKQRILLLTYGPKLELTWMLGLVTGHDLRQGQHIEIDMEDVKRLREAVDELWPYLQLHVRFYCIFRQ